MVQFGKNMKASLDSANNFDSKLLNPRPLYLYQVPNSKSEMNKKKKCCTQVSYKKKICFFFKLRSPYFIGGLINKKGEMFIRQYASSFFSFVSVFLTSYKYNLLQNVMTGPMVMIVTRTVVVTVVMIFPVTNCLVSVTGDVILDTQTLTVAQVYLYIQKHKIHFCCLMISRLLLQLMKAMINMLRNEQFIGIADICCFFF